MLEDLPDKTEDLPVPLVKDSNGKWITTDSEETRCNKIESRIKIKCIPDCVFLIVFNQCETGANIKYKRYSKNGRMYHSR